jgi:hypothetical protein
MLHCREGRGEPVRRYDLTADLVGRALSLEPWYRRFDILQLKAVHINLSPDQPTYYLSSNISSSLQLLNSASPST